MAISYSSDFDLKDSKNPKKNLKSEEESRENLLKYMEMALNYRSHRYKGLEKVFEEEYKKTMEEQELHPVPGSHEWTAHMRAKNKQIAKGNKNLGKKIQSYDGMNLSLYMEDTPGRESICWLVDVSAQNPKIVGMASLYVEKTAVRRTAKIDDVAVLPEERGLGYGAMLIEGITSQYSKRRSKVNEILVNNIAKGLEPFYAKLGFSIRQGARQTHGYISF